MYVLATTDVSVRWYCVARDRSSFELLEISLYVQYYALCHHASHTPSKKRPHEGPMKVESQSLSLMQQCLQQGLESLPV